MKAKSLVIFLLVLLVIIPVLVAVLLVSVVLGGNNAQAQSCPSAPGIGTAPANSTLFQAIKVAAKAQPRLVLSMLLTTNLESDWRLDAVGNGSYGPYQIQDPGVLNKGITVAQAEDAAYSTNYMLPRYEAWLPRESEALWQDVTNDGPEKAAEDIGFHAEKPAVDYYVSRGATRVHEADVASIAVMKSIGVPLDFSGTSTKPSATPSPGTISTVTDNCNTTPGPPGQYERPLRAVQGLQPNRIDQGVDYGGTGPVYALGNGKITLVYTGNGWPGGHYIAYQLSDGPAAGKYVYVAEDCVPTVKLGQQITSGTALCNMYNGGDGIETGWSTPPGTLDLAIARSQYAFDGLATAYGTNFSQLLQSLGDPPGIQKSSYIGGTLPLNWPTWLKKQA